MANYGVFEAAVSSETEVGLARQAAVDTFNAAIYDVREKLGPALFAASSLGEFRDRVAMMKNDQSLFRIIGVHTPPITGTVRRIVGKNSVLEKEFKARLASEYDNERCKSCGQRFRIEGHGEDCGKGLNDANSPLRDDGRYEARRRQADAQEPGWFGAGPDQSTATPEHPDAQWRADYLRKLYDNATHHNDPGVTGGPTMNAEDLPQSGTMVSIPGAEKQYPTMPSSQQVKEYFDTHHFGPEDYPGGWEWPPANDPSHHDTPRFYMDESRNYADPWEAGQAALEGDQIGVYDLSGDWSEQGKPSSVLTNQFINDQIAKGGARVGQSTHDTRRGTRPSGREISQSGTGRGAGTAGSPPVRRANRRSLDAQGVGSAHDSDAVFDWTPGSSQVGVGNSTPLSKSLTDSFAPKTNNDQFVDGPSGTSGSAGVSGTPTGGSIDTDITNNGGKGSFAETGKFPTQVTSRRTACYPGCEKNEAHAKKYHKDKEAGKINYRDNFTNQVAANVSRGEAAGYRQGHSTEQGQSRAVRGVSPTTSLDAKTGSDHLAGRLLRGLRYLQSAGAVGEPSGQRQGSAVGQEDWGTALQRRAAIQRSAEALRFALSELPTAVRVSDRQSLLADLRGVLRTAGAPEGFIDHVAGFEGTQDLDETFEPSEGPLVPTDNFDGYLDSVDQGAPEKVERNFTSAVLYRDWCEANNLSPIRLSSLDAYADRLSDADYFRLARYIQSCSDWPSNHSPKTPKGQDSKKLKDVTAAKNCTGCGKPIDPLEEFPGGKCLDCHAGDPAVKHRNDNMTAEELANMWGADVLRKHKGSVDPMRTYIAWCQRNGLQRMSARNVNIFAKGEPRLVMHLAQRMRRAIAAARERQAGEYGPGHHFESEIPGVPEHYEADQPQEFWDAYAQHRERGYHPPAAWARAFAEHGVAAPKHQASRRTAAPDYLQKADDALTQLLNQKAQEFQETIAPLQQALVTVQQAEQLQQQQNPMNVLPPPGTVNVLPGQAAPGQVGVPDPSGGADPNAAAAAALAAPAGDPSMGGGDPSMGAGAPPPAAGPQGALPPDPSQQMMARRRRAGGQGKE